MKKLMTMAIVGIAIMTSAASAGTQIDGSTITATTRDAWHITEASALVDPALEVGEQYIVPKWDTTPFPDLFAFAEVVDGWVMFDLGAEYDLDEIRLWNGNMSHGDLGLMRPVTMVSGMSPLILIPSMALAPVCWAIFRSMR